MPVFAADEVRHQHVITFSSLHECAMQLLACTAETFDTLIDPQR